MCMKICLYIIYIIIIYVYKNANIKMEKKKSSCSCTAQSCCLESWSHGCWVGVDLDLVGTSFDGLGGNAVFVGGRAADPSAASVRVAWCFHTMGRQQPVIDKMIDTTNNSSLKLLDLPCWVPPEREYYLWLPPLLCKGRSMSRLCEVLVTTAPS